MAGINYNGDRATILPDNTQATMHLFDQFAQNERLKQAKAIQDQQDEQNRQIAFSKYMGDALDAKNFDPSQQQDIDAAKKEIQRAILLKKPIPELMSMADDYANNLHTTGNKIKQSTAQIAAQAADYVKAHPGADHAALVQAGIKKAKESNWDTNQNHIGIAADELFKGGILYPKESINAAKSAIFDKNALVDVSEEPQVDETTGDVVKKGIRGKINPDLVQIVRDDKGNIQYDPSTGKPVYTVKAQNYKIGDKDVLDKDGKPVKVVSDEVFDKYYQGGIAQEIDQRVRQELAQPVMSKEGPVQFNPDGEYADMLRKKYLLEDLQKSTTGKFDVGVPDNNGWKIKQALLKDRQAQQRLDMAERKTNAMINKLSTSGSGGVESQDIYKGIDDQTAKDKAAGFGLTRVNALPVETQKVIVDYANQVAGSGKEGEKITQADIFLKRTDDDKIQIVRKDDLVPIGELSYTGTNTKVNTSQKERQSVYQKAKDFAGKVVDKVRGKTPPAAPKTPPVSMK